MRFLAFLYPTKLIQFCIFTEQHKCIVKREIQNIKLVIDLVTKIEMYYILFVMFPRIPVALNWEASNFSGKKRVTK